VQRDGDGHGTLGPQGDHRPLGLGLAARRLHPGAAQVGQLVELDAVLLQRGGAAV